MVAQARRVSRAQTKPKQNPNPAPERWKGDILDLTCIGRGISAMIFAINDTKVIKVDFGSDQSKSDMQTERRAFRILEKTKDRSPHIIGCFEADNPRGVVLERCQETLRGRLRSMPSGVSPSPTNARRWAKQAAEGLAFIHKHDIIHADVGCHNMLLTSADELKICDFGGSSVNNSFAATKYEVWSRPPFKEESPPTQSSDLFALGSAIYEMATKEEPYRGKSAGEVSKLYQKGKFPSVKNIVNLGHIITKCWLQQYATASDIFQEIDPQNSLCCRLQDMSVKEIASLPANGSDTKIAKYSTISGSDSLQASAKSTSSSPKTSSSSSSSSKSPTNVTRSLAHLWSFNTHPIKNNTTHFDNGKNSDDHKKESQAILKNPSIRNDRKSAKKRTRHQSHLLQWMSKSIQPHGNHNGQ